MPTTKPNNTAVILKFTALLWIIEIIDQLLLQGHLDRFGIRPRTLTGLIGIPLMPLLHGSFAHLVSNTLPLLTLGYITAKTAPQKFIPTTITLIILSGLGTWLIAGKNQIHIGASALIYAYFGYIITTAITQKRPLQILIALIVAILYGSMIYGIFPNQPNISWQGHLSGLLSGILLAYTTPKSQKQNRTKPFN